MAGAVLPSEHGAGEAAIAFGYVLADGPPAVARPVGPLADAAAIAAGVREKIVGAHVLCVASGGGFEFRVPAHWAYGRHVAGAAVAALSPQSVDEREHVRFLGFAEFCRRFMASWICKGGKKETAREDDFCC